MADNLGLLGEAYVAVRALLDDVKKDLDAGLGPIQKDLKEWGGKISGAGKGISVAITAPIVAAAGAALAAGVTIDSAFDTIRKSTGATGKTLEGLQTSFENVFATVPSGAEEVALATAKLNQGLGATGPTLENLTRQTTTLARLYDEDLNAVLTSSTQLFNVWGVSAEQGSAQLDLVNQVSQATGASITALLGGLVEAAPRLQQFGISLADGAVMLGSWEKAGLNGAQILAGMGVAARKFAEANIPAQEGLAGIIARIEQLGPAAANAADVQAVFGRSTATMVTAVLAGQLSIDKMRESMDLSGDSIMELAGQTDDFTEKWAAVRNQLVLALEPLGTTLMDVLGRLAPLMATVAGWIAKMTSYFAELSTPLQAVVLGFGAVLAAIGPLLIVIGQVVSAVGTLLPMWPAIASALGVLTGPIGLVVAAAAGLAYIFREELGTAIVAVSSWVYNAVKAFGSFMAPLASSAWSAAVAVFNALGSVLRMVGEVVALVAQGIVWLLDKLGITTAAVWGFKAALWVVREVATLVFQAIEGLFKGIGWLADKIGGFVKSVREWFGGAGQAAATAMPQIEAMASHGVDVVATAAAKAGPPVKALTADALDLGKAGNEAKKALQGLADELSGKTLKAAVTQLNQAWGLLTKTQKENVLTIGRVKEKIKDLVDAGGLPSLSDELHLLWVREVAVKELNGLLSADFKFLATNAIPGATLALRKHNLTLEEELDLIRKKAALSGLIKPFDMSLLGPGVDLSGFKPPTAMQGFLQSMLSMGTGLSQDMGATIMQAITGGGNVTQSIGALAGKYIGSSLSNNFGVTLDKHLPKQLAGSIKGMLPGLGSLAGAGLAGLGDMLSKKLGDGVMGNAASWATKGMALGGPWGAAIGAGVGAIVGAFKKGQNTTKKARESFAKELGFGNIDKLYAELRSIGKEGEKLVNTSLNVIGKKDTAANAQWMKDVEAALAKHAQLVATMVPTWSEAADLAEKYGIEIGALGPKFQQGQLNQMANDLAVDFRKLVAFGADVNGVLAGMKDEAQDVVTQALKLGLDVPEGMRKMLEMLVANGDLLDENGEKMMDLSRLHFTQTIEEGIASLIEKLDEFISKLGSGVAAAATVGVEATRRAWGGFRAPNLAGDGSSGPVDEGDQHVTGWSVPEFDTGGIGNFGSGAMAMLHNAEAVYPLDRLERFILRDVARAAGGGAPRLAPQINVTVQQSITLSSPDANAMRRLVRGDLKDELVQLAVDGSDDWARKMVEAFARFQTEGA